MRAEADSTRVRLFRDRLDVDAMLADGLVTRQGLRAAFEEIRPLLIRFPAIDVRSFERRVHERCDPQGEPGGGRP